MSSLPIQPLSREEQQRRMGELYLLLGEQVKSYHQHRRMGENTSVPAELARELMESMEYTLEFSGGIGAVHDVRQGLKMGQELLKEKQCKANALLELVTATAPDWQTECRWEALGCLRQYLAGYDGQHLAHRGPETLFYPLPMATPEGLRGIEQCLFYLGVLWTENQIMAGFSDDALGQLRDRLPVDMLNQCEQVIANSLGKGILSESWEELTFTDGERERLRQLLSGQSPQQLRQTLHRAALALCRGLKLPENGAAYVCAVAEGMAPRLEGVVKYDNLAAVFL